MKTVLVTTWNQPCGIAEHSAYLVEAVQRADPTIEIEIVTDLHPAAVLRRDVVPSLTVLNYHAALLSQWHASHLAALQARGGKSLVIWHDSGVPNSDQCKAVIEAADAAVVHEPFDDLPAEKVRYWRMGVPDWELPMTFDLRPDSWSGGRPVLGSIGFPFGWKNYDQLARVTAACGWALLLIAPTATTEQIEQWRALNPHLDVYRDFVPRRDALVLLSACDVTAFCYVCHNTGQSAAILQGIAARKPVIAFSTCRQNRALYGDALGRRTIRWAMGFAEVAQMLWSDIPIQRVDPATVALAEQENWWKVGQRYAALYRELAGAER